MTTSILNIKRQNKKTHLNTHTQTHIERPKNDKSVEGKRKILRPWLLNANSLLPNLWVFHPLFNHPIGIVCALLFYVWFSMLSLSCWKPPQRCIRYTYIYMCKTSVKIYFHAGKFVLLEYRFVFSTLLEMVVWIFDLKIFRCETDALENWSERNWWNSLAA